jgi:uncharacterized membrane protein
MWDLFVSVFVIAALALVFAHAWNMVAEMSLATFERRNPDGTIRHPLRQTIYYAIGVSLISILVVWYIHNHTTIDLGAGHKRSHRSS